MTKENQEAMLPLESQVMGAMQPLCRPRVKPCRWYWANRQFTRPGLYVWLWGENRRVLPWPKWNRM